MDYLKIQNQLKKIDEVIIKERDRVDIMAKEKVLRCLEVKSEHLQELDNRINEAINELDWFIYTE